MVDGGDNIREATWESVSSMLQVVSEMKRMLHVGLNICVEQREVCTSWFVFTLVKLSLI